jgi:FAD/FMN-containing dehydrogenase
MTELSFDLSQIDWAAFARDLAPVPVIAEPALVKQKSRDFYWYSPILREKLNDRFGNLVAVPRDEDDVRRVVSACVKAKVPLTVRGAGTGNYGQAMPLYGGVILETTALNRVKWVRNGVMRVEAGARLKDIDAELRPQGWELRMHPSTKRTATIGGFIAGGSGGIGSITFGQLRDRGNVHGLRVLPMTEGGDAIELRGDDIQKANHAYGTNGIFTELEIPLGPAHDWADYILGFDDFGAAMAFAQELGEADGIVKKLITPIAWPIPAWLHGLREYIPDGRHIVLCMIAEGSRESFETLVHLRGAQALYEKDQAEVDAGLTPLYEYSWNHTTLQILKTDRSITYLQALFPPGRNLELVQRMNAHFGDEVLMHAEMIRWGGRITNIALQIVRYSTPERLYEIIRHHEANGVSIADPHTYVLEDGGMKTIDADQLGFKLRNDPYGLLNPGKMRGWLERDKIDTTRKSLYSGA